MKREWSIRWTIVLSLGTLLISGQLFAATYSDNFEASPLNPFWTLSASNGSVVLGAAHVHSGLQSLQFTTTPPLSGNMGVQVRHDFGSPVYGSASIWVYDSAADQTSGNYIEFYLYNSALASRAGLYTQDFDLGPSNGGHYYYDIFSGSGNSNVDRTQAWHLFQITSLPNLLQLSIDGTIVHSAAAGTPFNGVALETHAPGWRPGFTVNYDEFEMNVVPEPSALALIVIFTSLSAVWNTRTVRSITER